MSHGPEHQIEHAEHAAHASHDAFNRMVTMSIAIVAAILACVTMLGHRAHNETLRLQGEALALQTKASITSTEAANRWAYYQSKNMSSLEAEITLDLLSILPTRQDRKIEFNEILGRYEDNVKKYKGAAETSGSSGDKAKSKGKLAEIRDEAEQLTKESKKKLEEAEEKIKESHEMHGKGDRFDYSELGLQFGVVLCSLAILTKSRGFWFAGLLSSGVGAAIAMTAQFGLLGGHH
jgi:hypothetical protein